MQSEEEIINPYFERFVDGVNSRDPQALQGLFSAETLAVCDALPAQVTAAFSYFPGHLTITEDANGIHSATSVTDGERRAEIDALFTVEANGQAFYAAMKICSKDSVNGENEGILSVYFISAQDYNDPIHYRGDGKWTPGIHLQ